MAKLPLDQAVVRFQGNEERMDVFANGNSSADYISTAGSSVPSIQKFLTLKDTEINVSATGILAQATTQANNAANSLAAMSSTKIDFDAKYAAAMAAGLPDAADSAASAAASAAAAEASWTAALAADNSLNPVIRMNPTTITADITIPAGYNAGSVGPITVADGITVTLEDNSNWSIL